MEDEKDILGAFDDIEGFDSYLSLNEVDGRGTFEFTHQTPSIRIDSDTNVEICGDIYTGQELQQQMKLMKVLLKEKFPEEFI